jgi:hypothetical protein
MPLWTGRRLAYSTVQKTGAAAVVGWTNPEGTRPYLGALLLGYYDPDGRLV